MAKGFNVLWWGFLFTLFDLRINGFDIMPNFLGYGMILLGINILSEYSEFFRRAKALAIALVAISIPSALEIRYNSLGDMDNILYVFMALGILILFLDLKLVEQLFQGIADIARAREMIELEEEGLEAWQRYKKIKIGVFIALYSGVLLPVFFIVLIIPIIGASIYLLVKTLQFFTKVKEKIAF